VREDRVRQGSLGVFAAHEYHWSDQLRSYLGLRHDAYRFDVDGEVSDNRGRARDGITSYKGSLAWRPLQALELYASYGTGFHSNDARGVTTRLDPASGEPATPADALVGSRGSELGARLQWTDAFNATFALWQLQLDSELLFVGDAGTTEANRGSRRRGAEAGLYWHPGERWTAHLEAAYTRARFSDPDPAGDRIPGSVPLVIAGGVTARLGEGWSTSAQLRHFGAYPLIEDGSVRSQGSTLLNLRAGREWGRWGVHFDVLNALDSRDHDIDYFYASRLPGEADAGVEDVHFHVFPRRSLKLTLQWRY
jgi:outer membrane receptor protein involved in Fe transport